VAAAQGVFPFPKFSAESLVNPMYGTLGPTSTGDSSTLGSMSPGPQSVCSTPVMQPLGMVSMTASMSAQGFSTAGTHGGPDLPRLPSVSSVQREHVGILPSPRSLQRSEVEVDPFRIAPNSREKFSRMFDEVDINGSGYITGAQARVALAQSGLPNADLRRIWDLADAGKDGMLDRHEFIVCQFLIAHRLGGNELPDKLPPGLQETAGPVHSHLNSLASDSSAGVSGRGALNLMAPMRADFDSRSVSPSPATALRVSSAAPSPLLRSGHNNVPSRTNSSDDIQLQDYARFVEHFRNIDTDADGYVSGLEARPLLTQSELPVAELRKIWDLADMTSDGRLDRHEFAVAMILIQARQKGAALPESLPAHLRSPPDIFTAGGSRKQLPADISSQSSFSSAGVPSSNVSPTANGGLAARALARDPESITSSPLVQSASVYLPATASGPMGRCMPA